MVSVLVSTKQNQPTRMQFGTASNMTFSISITVAIILFSQDKRMTDVQQMIAVSNGNNRCIHSPLKTFNNNNHLF